jgi:hypothetical protein
VVETLLLRWTVMDRVAELEQVIAGMPRDIPAEPLARRPVPGRPDTPPPTNPPSRGFSAGPGGLELSLPSLLAVWPDILAAATLRSRFLGQGLAATTPRLAGKGEVHLEAAANQAALVEGVSRQLPAVEALIGERFAGPVKVRIVADAGTAAPVPARITDQGLKAERLDRLRKIDPALDTAADELDLEIVDGDPNG